MLAVPCPRQWPISADGHGKLYGHPSFDMCCPCDFVDVVLVSGTFVNCRLVYDRQATLKVAVSITFQAINSIQTRLAIEWNQSVLRRQYVHQYVLPCTCMRRVSWQEESIIIRLEMIIQWSCLPLKSDQNLSIKNVCSFIYLFWNLSEIQTWCELCYSFCGHWFGFIMFRFFHRKTFCVFFHQKTIQFEFGSSALSSQNVLWRFYTHRHQGT